MNPIKLMQSRFGGHAFKLGRGKASDENLPDDQSLDNLLDNYAINADGFSYLSSYQMKPEFMGSYEKLPLKAVKLAEIYHVYTEMMFQFEVFTTSVVYLAQLKYSNVYAVFIKTDLEPINDAFGIDEHEDPTYDLVLIVHAVEIEAVELKKRMTRFIEVCLLTLFYEMNIYDPDVTPSKTYLGKKIDVASLEAQIKEFKPYQKLEEFISAIKF